MANKLIRHGTDAGYRAELQTGKACDRCREAHRIYNTQFRAHNKAKGVKYARDAVLVGVGSGGRIGPTMGAGEVPPVASRTVPRGMPRDAPDSSTEGTDGMGGGERPGASLGDRVGALLGRVAGDSNSEYVPDDETPDYLHAVDPDPEPTDPEWSEVTEEEFVINAAGMAKIEENLGTYISVIGITMEMVDPYCGAILANNIPKMVERWTKVIAHYPKAANLFLDSKGGVIMQWIGAIQASWPFLWAIYEHHLARTIRVHDGVIERKIGDNPFQGFDATMPPMQDKFAYTVS